MDILSPVEKLIHYRKMYKISQEELVRNSIARSYLAMIESKRKKLNNKVATILVENFNTILKEKEINFSLSLEYLLEEKETQISKITETMFLKLNSQNVDEISFNADKLFLEEDSVENKKKIYFAIANIYFSSNNYQKANFYFNAILADLIKNNDDKQFEEAVIKICKCNLQLENFEENILFRNKIHKFTADFSKEGLKELKFILAICGQKTGKCKNSVEIFKELEKSCELDKIFELKMLQAECFINSENFEDATSVYRGSLLKFKSKNKKFIVNYKLLKLSRLQNDDEKSELYLRKISNLLNEINSSDIEDFDEILLVIALSSKELGKRKKALNYFQQLLEISNNNDIKIKAIFYAIDLLRKQEIKQLQLLETIYFQLLNDTKCFNLGYKFIDFYSVNGLTKYEENFKKQIMKFI